MGALQEPEKQAIGLALGQAVQIDPRFYDNPTLGDLLVCWPIDWMKAMCRRRLRLRHCGERPRIFRCRWMHRNRLFLFIDQKNGLLLALERAGSLGHRFPEDPVLQSGEFVLC
jgi:hypothetical protein